MGAVPSRVLKKSFAGHGPAPREAIDLPLWRGVHELRYTRPLEIVIINDGIRVKIATLAY